MIKRNLVEIIRETALGRKKMAFISGPRQCGKTTLSHELASHYSPFQYYNWDNKTTRKAWSKDPESLVVEKVQTFIFDEIHKTKLWKRDLKGIFDTHSDRNYLITGSSKLNVFRKGGDSLLGRYYHFHLHPFTLGELNQKKITAADEILKKALSAKPSSLKVTQLYEDLFNYSGFPEPFLSKTKRSLKLWQKTRSERIVYEDLRDLSNVPDLSQVERLMLLIPDTVGGLTSFESLRRELEVSFNTVKHWYGLLEALYYCFKVTPFVGSLARSLKKEAKTFLWDYTEVKDEGARFENLVALHLLKACDAWNDWGEGDFKLHYLRDKEKREVDLLIVRDKKPWLAVECKLSDSHLSPHLPYFCERLKIPFALQLTHQKCEPYTKKTTHTHYSVMTASDFLSEWI